MEDKETDEKVSPVKKKRAFSIDFKLRAFSYAKSTSISAAAKAFGLHRQNVSLWCQKEDSLKEEHVSRSRKRTPGAGRKKFSEELEEEVYNWVIQQRNEKLPVSRR